DFLIMNTDRHAGNWLASSQDPTKLVLIDHGLSFPDKRVRELNFSTRLLTRAMGAKVPPDVAGWAEAGKGIEAALRRYGIPETAVRMTSARLDALVAAAKDGKTFRQLVKSEGIKE